MGDGAPGPGGVSTTGDRELPTPVDVQVPAALAEYADRLLLSTGLHAEDALLIAGGKLDPPAEMQQLAIALRAGWKLTEEQT